MSTAPSKVSKLIPRFTLFVGNHCSLCVTAKEALENARKQLPFEVDTVNIYDQGQERWKRRYVYEIPVLMLGDEIKAKGRWGESEVLKALQEFRQKQEEEGERKA